MEDATQNDALLLGEYSKTRNAEAFAELVSRYAGMVYGTCLRIVRNQHEAEDVAQECFMELARKADTIRSSVGGWLHSLATSRSKNFIRDACSRRHHETEAAWQADQSPEPKWEQIAPFVDDAIENLPEDLRLPLMLHFLHGQNQTQIAEKLGINQSTVSRRLEIGVDELRRKLKKAGIVTTVIALAAMLAPNASVAAPSALMASLSKMAMAGVSQATAIAGAAPAATAATTFAGTAAAKVAAIAISAAIVAGGAAVYERASKRMSSPEFKPGAEVSFLPAKALSGSDNGGPDSQPAAGLPQDSYDASEKPTITPVKPGLVGWWKFDEGSGNIVRDSSGYGNDAVTDARWVEGVMGNALDFQALHSVKVPPAVFLPVSNQISIAFWQYGNPQTQPQENSVFEAYDIYDKRVLNCHLPWPWGGPLVCLEISPHNGFSKHANPDEYKGRWNHWVFTKDVNTGRMRMYLNGGLWSSMDRQHGAIQGIIKFSVGGGVSGRLNYDGAIDDFRVYSRELNLAEISEIYQEGRSQGNADGRVSFETAAK